MWGSACGDQYIVQMYCLYCVLQVCQQVPVVGLVNCLSNVAMTISSVKPRKWYVLIVYRNIYAMSETKKVVCIDCVLETFMP